MGRHAQYFSAPGCVCVRFNVFLNIQFNNIVDKYIANVNLPCTIEILDAILVNVLYVLLS